MYGMCERSAFDTFYHMDNDEKGLVTFYGFESSIIRYDTKERLWVLNIINKPDLCPPEKTQHPGYFSFIQIPFKARRKKNG